MGIEKAGLNLGKEIIAWTRTSGSKSLLATRPVKVNITELKLAPQLCKDTLCIGSKTNEAKKILSKIDLNQCIKETSLIGSGGEAAVYEIEGTDFLLRVHHNPLTGEKIKTLNLTSEIDFNVTAQDKVNNIVGKFKGGEIVKRIKGEVVQTTVDKDIFRGINNISDNNIKEYLRKIFEAEKEGLYHDNFGANALFDKTSGKLTPIDFWENKSDGILSSIMDQCTSPLINKEKLIKKTLRNLFEMIKKGEVDSRRLTLNCKQHWLQDRSFATEIENICNSFNKNKSQDNIDFLLKKLNLLNEFNPEKTQNMIIELNEIEKELSKISTLPMDIPNREKQIEYFKNSIKKIKSIIDWQKSEISYIR